MSKDECAMSNEQVKSCNNCITRLLLSPPKLSVGPGAANLRSSKSRLSR